MVAEPLGRALGQNVIVENRAGGNIGADTVAQSPPDGHSMLLLDVSVLATNPFLFARLPFDVERDLAPVQMVIYAPYILAVGNRLPAKNAAELVAYAKANRGKLNAANSGAGTLTHIVALSRSVQVRPQRHQKAPRRTKSQASQFRHGPVSHRMSGARRPRAQRW